MGKEWIIVNEIGQLFLEKILVSFDVPILFVCVDYKNRKYLCLNVDTESGKTVIVSTDNRHLVDMLKNKITMYSVFRNSIDGKAIIAEYDFVDERVVSNVENANLISVSLLPKENEYFEYTNKALKEYISYLERQLVTVEVESFSEKKTFKIQYCCELVYSDEENSMARSCNKVMLKTVISKSSYSIIDDGKMIA